MNTPEALANSLKEVPILTNYSLVKKLRLGMILLTSMGFGIAVANQTEQAKASTGKDSDITFTDSQNNTVRLLRYQGVRAVYPPNNNPNQGMSAIGKTVNGGEETYFQSKLSNHPSVNSRVELSDMDRNGNDKTTTMWLTFGNSNDEYSVQVVTFPDGQEEQGGYRENDGCLPENIYPTGSYVDSNGNIKVSLINNRLYTINSTQCFFEENTPTPTFTPTSTSTPVAIPSVSPTVIPQPNPKKKFTASMRVKNRKGTVTLFQKAKTDNSCLPIVYENKIAGEASPLNPLIRYLSAGTYYAEGKSSDNCGRQIIFSPRTVLVKATKK